jgi:hypothetical protein
MAKMSKGQGSANCGAKSMSSYAKRPPKRSGGVANDVAQWAPRSAVMPPPAKDTTYRRGGKRGG